MIYLIDEQMTKYIGEKIGKLLKPNDVLALTGDLGAGKTMMTQSIARGMGIEDYITSPTFTIVQEYEGKLPLFHFDVYRIADEEEMYYLGFDEYLARGGVCIIEWANLIENILPKERLDIELLYTEKEGRNMRLTPHGSRYEDLVKELIEE